MMRVSLPPPQASKSMPSPHFCTWDTTTDQGCYSRSAAVALPHKSALGDRAETDWNSLSRYKETYVTLGNTSERRLGNGCVHGDHENILQYLLLEKGCILLVTSRTAESRGQQTLSGKGQMVNILGAIGHLQTITYSSLFLFCFAFYNPLKIQITFLSLQAESQIWPTVQGNVPLPRVYLAFLRDH